jgi:hypothetical protein
VAAYAPDCNIKYGSFCLLISMVKKLLISSLQIPRGRAVNPLSKNNIHEAIAMLSAALTVIACYPD